MLQRDNCEKNPELDLDDDEVEETELEKEVEVRHVHGRQDLLTCSLSRETCRRS